MNTARIRINAKGNAVKKRKIASSKGNVSGVTQLRKQLRNP
jgi:hypothetical protein